jgi:hypothetical protein
MSQHILAFFFLVAKVPLGLWAGVDRMSWRGDPGSFRQLNHHLAPPPQTRLCTRPYTPVLDDLLTRSASNAKPIRSTTVPENGYGAV